MFMLYKLIMVTNYDIDKNNYKIYHLKGTIFLFNDDLVKSISIDNGTANISLQGKPLTVKCEAVEVTEESSLEGRFSFTHKVSFKVQGYDNGLVGYKWIGFQDASNECWLLNPMLEPSWSYKYTLDSQGEVTTYTASLVSNFPLLHIVGTERFEEIQNPCGYHMAVPSKLFLNESKYTAKTNDGNILYTNNGFKEIEFIKNSLSLTEDFDGEGITHSLSFKIPFSSYKESFHYNLLEFTDNKYACAVKKTDGTYSSCGFSYGLLPSYSISCDTDIENADTITITLTDKHDSENFFSVSSAFTQIYESSTSSEFIIKDECLECIGNGIAKFIMKTEIDALGNPTGRYYALKGYEEQLRNEGYNIIGTFEGDVQVAHKGCNGSGSTGSGSTGGGSTGGGSTGSGSTECSLDTNLSDMVFHEKGEKNTFKVKAEGGWKIRYSGGHLSFSTKSATDSKAYAVTIEALVSPVSVPYLDTFTLEYCDGKKTTYNAYIKLKACKDYLSDNMIPKSGGDRTLKSDCCISSVTSSTEGVLTLKTHWGYIISIPAMEGTEERTIPLTVTRCNGEVDKSLTIKQVPYCYVWKREGTECSEGYLCDVERLFSGETNSYITGRTDTTRLVNCALNSTSCSYDRTRWVDANDTVCDGKALCSLLAEETSTDGFVWTRTGKYKLGTVIDEANDAICGPNYSTKYGKWFEVDGYICDGTTKYKKIGFFTSFSLNGEYYETNVVDKGDVIEYNSENCGWFEGIDDYRTRWEKVGEECIGTTKCNKLKARYFSKEDGSEYTQSIDQYKYEEIEKYSEDCGFINEYNRWKLTNIVKCFECNE